MKILMVDDSESRRETLAAHTCAGVWRVMPAELFSNPELLKAADALALGHDMCEAPDDGEVFCCPNQNERGGCACPDGVDVARWLIPRLDGLRRRERRIVVVSANPAGAQRMLNILRDPALVGSLGRNVEQCSASRWGRYDTTTRRNIRAAFGLPLDWEATP